ncbi:hypothetical protein GC197_04410 [bacterium]|nr:hypothetical protein [bacterium]
MPKQSLAIVIALLGLLSAGRIAHAQTNQPLSKEQVIANLNAETNRLDGILQGLQIKHAASVQEVEKKTIEELKILAKSEAANGAIAAAKDTWTEVVKLDPSDEDAIKFFTAIGKLEIVEQAKKARQANPLQTISIPKQRIEWQSDDGYVFRRASEKVWVREFTDENGKLVNNGTMKEDSVSPYCIEISREGRNYKTLFRIYDGQVLGRGNNARLWNIYKTGHWVK